MQLKDETTGCWQPPPQQPYPAVPSVDSRLKSTHMPATAFAWDDPILLEQQLHADKRAIRDAAQHDARGALAPRILKAFAS